MLLAGVIRSENALALLGGQSRSGVGDFNHHFSVSRACVRTVSVPPLGIASIAFSTRFDSARCSRSGSAAIVPRFSSNSSLHSIGSAPRRLQLCLVKFQHPAHDLIHLHRLQLRMRHLRKFAEAPDNRLQV